MAEWSIWLLDPAGAQLALLDRLETARLVRVVNGAGWWELLLPGDFDESLLVVDGIVEFWRKPTGGTKTRQLSGFIRKKIFETNAAGISRVMIAGPDVNELLARRIVAYAAGSSGASKTDQADDILKAIIRENLGASASDPDRNLTAAGLSVAGDEADGPSLTLSFSWANLADTAQELVDAAAGAGTPVYWEFVPQGGAGLQLLTYTGQPGADRTDPRNPVVFGLEWGNLTEPVLEEDYTEEVNYVYAGGQDEGSERLIVEVEDAARSSRSPWNRREAFADARNESTTAGVTAAANARLEAGRPVLRFSGKLLDTHQAHYGIDWAFGDRVLVTYRGRQFNSLVKAVEISLDGNGQEIITAMIDVEDMILGGGGVPA